MPDRQPSPRGVSGQAMAEETPEVVLRAYPGGSASGGAVPAGPGNRPGGVTRPPGQRSRGRDPAAPSWGRRRVLLLNATFEPLTALPLRRAVVLVMCGKAEVVHGDPGGIELHAATVSLPVPSVIRLQHVRAGAVPGQGAADPRRADAPRPVSLRVLRRAGRDDRPRHPAQPWRTAQLDELRRLLRQVQPPQGGPAALGDRLAAARRPAGAARPALAAARALQGGRESHADDGHSSPRSCSTSTCGGPSPRSRPGRGSTGAWRSSSSRSRSDREHGRDARLVTASDGRARGPYCYSVMPCRACQRASGAGAHQFHRPRRVMVAGTSSIRTIVASRTTATTSATPISLMMSS